MIYIYTTAMIGGFSLMLALFVDLIFYTNDLLLHYCYN